MSFHWNLFRRADLKKRETWPSSLSQMNALFLLILSSSTYEVLMLQISFSFFATCLSAVALPKCESPHPLWLSPLHHCEGHWLPGWRFLPLLPVNTFCLCQKAAVAWLLSPWARLCCKHKPRSYMNCKVRPFALVSHITGLSQRSMWQKKSSKPY